MLSPWPSSPLQAASRAFDLLTHPPAPLEFDARGLAGLPPRTLPLDELRTVLLDRACPRSLRDGVWRELVARARRDGPAWVVAAVGVALPGLLHAASQLAAGWRGDTADLDAELLAGFLQRLHTLDLAAPRVVGRLIDAGVRAARRARDAEVDVEHVRVPGGWSRPPLQPWDHPDWVLARAVVAAVIDTDEAALIGSTRLEGLTLAQAGAELGISANLAATWRRNAERRLVHAITSGELDHVSIGAGRRRVAAHR